VQGALDRQCKRSFRIVYSTNAPGNDILDEQALPLEQRRKVKATSTLEVVYTMEIPAAAAVSTAAVPPAAAAAAAAAATSTTAAVAAAVTALSAPVAPTSLAAAPVKSAAPSRSVAAPAVAPAAAVTDVPCQHKPAVSTLLHAAPQYLLQISAQQQQHTLSSATAASTTAATAPPAAAVLDDVCEFQFGEDTCMALGDYTGVACDLSMAGAPVVTSSTTAALLAGTSAALTAATTSTTTSAATTTATAASGRAFAFASSADSLPAAAAAVAVTSRPMAAVRQPLLDSSCTASNAAAGTVASSAVVTPSPLVTAGGTAAQHSGVDATLARFGCSSGLATTSSPALRTLPLTLSPAAALVAAAAVAPPTVDDDAEAALQLHNSSNSTMAFMQGLDELAGCDADGGNGALSCGFSLFDGQEHKQSLSRSFSGLFSSLGSSCDYLQAPPLFQGASRVTPDTKQK
jgi:hypothetical protein